MHLIGYGSVEDSHFLFLTEFYLLTLNTGKQYVTAIPVVSSSVQNQHEAIQPGASYQQNVVGTYVQVVICLYSGKNSTTQPMCS